MTISQATKDWTRNVSDERAIANGCFFDEAAGQFVVDWIERLCRLYEGEWAGQPMLITDWVYEATMRMFGWQKYSKRWKRNIRRFRSASYFVPKKQKKALALDTMIPTPTGWTTIGEINVGDEIFGENGATCRVTEVHPIVVDDECYKMSFSNGEVVRCNGDHLWRTMALQRSIKGAKGKLFTGNKYTGSLNRVWNPHAVRTTSQIFASEKRSDGARNHSIQMPHPVELPPADLQIHPYVLGAWLGDGDSDGARLTCSKGDYAHWRESFGECGIEVRDFSPKRHSNAGRAPIGKKCGKFRTTLRHMGLLKNKHIPPEYLRASKEQRLALIQGLMDTDGCIDKSGKSLTFVSAKKHLAESFGELLSSLGIKFRIRAQPTPLGDGRWRDYYWVLFHSFADVTPVFRMERKLSRMRNLSCLSMKPRSRTVQIASIDRIGPIPMRCITVDNPSGMFLVGRTMIPTHNSPSLAAWGLYLMCGDGEMGQKVYFGAKDGMQAREIAGKHAVEMVMASEELSRECSINKSIMQITHGPTRSLLKPISSTDSRSQKAKEGLNGSILIDELHVCDESFMGRISRAGISRSEPLLIAVSTAGDDPESYGRKQYDYGKLIERGDLTDETFLFASWEAPQDLSDSDLAADPIKYGKLANPSWGQTVGEEEFLADYNTSKASLSEFLRFKMYRLNIWQQSANPWLKLGDWHECRREFTEDDLAGRACWGGLDLAKTRDTTALVLNFPEEDGTFKQLAYFWLPQARAHDLKDKVRYLEWAEQGFLTLTTDNQVDYNFVRGKINDLRAKFDIRAIAFDGTYAAQLMQRLREEDGMGEQEQVEFKQTMMNFTAGTVAYENAIVEKRLHHNGHPLLTWQAGNVKVKSDYNENIRPIKQQHGDFRTVDGIVAGVMAFSMAMVGETAPAWGILL